MPALFSGLLPLVVIVLLLVYSIRVLREYERAVVFLLGRFWKVKGPGLVVIVPFIQQMVRMDLRTRVLDVPPQDVISKDNVSVKVNAVVYFRVIDPEKAVIQVEQFEAATSQFAQTTLRSVLGQHDLDQMLSEREKLNVEVQRILDERTDAWGVKVSNVELKHIDLNETMIRAIAKQAEAERLRRAKIIDAEGELQAAERLAQAGEILSKRPEAMQLRYSGHPAQHRRRAEQHHRLPAADGGPGEGAGAGGEEGVRIVGSDPAGLTPWRALLQMICGACPAVAIRTSRVAPLASIASIENETSVRLPPTNVIGIDLVLEPAYAGVVGRESGLRGR